MKGIAIYFFIFGVHWGKGVKGGPLGGTKKNEKRRKSPKNEKLRRSITQPKNPQKKMLKKSSSDCSVD